MRKKTSQAKKVISALEKTDQGLTANEMKNRFGVTNARALVTPSSEWFRHLFKQNT